MTVTLLADVEQIVSAYLRANTDITTLVGQNVYTVIPSNPVENNLFPLVQLTQFTDELTAPLIPRWKTARLQFSVWGGPKKLAWQIAETIRVLLVTDFPGSHTGGYCTVNEVSGLQDLPDASFDPPKPRWVFDATITARPG